jgi:V/A-type H+/Na+-transporting ATPase subunit C
MASSPYASALGRLKPYFPEFLGREAYGPLLSARDLAEVTKILEGSGYRADLAAARATYQGLTLVEVALNRMLVRRTHLAYATTPYAGKAIVGGYLARWDLQNIGLILSSKAQGRGLVETDEELVSSREVPAGLYAGVLTLDDLRGLLAQPTVEAVASALLKFGYGATIVPLLEGYQRSGDIFPILSALDREYFRNLLAQTRFFQGDEWVVREFLRGEVDLRNMLLLLKAKASPGVALDDVSARWIDGGSLPASAAGDLLSAANVPALADRLKERSPRLPEGDAAYAAAQSLAGYEAALWTDYALTTIERMRLYPLSLAIIFHYLLRAELERNDLRRIAIGALYQLPAERVTPQVVSARL